MKPPVLSVRELTVTHRATSLTANVVDRISFDLHASEILALVGESGCGKTKTAEAILRLLPENVWKIRAQAVQLGDTNLAVLPEPDMRKIRGSAVSMIFQEPLTALDPVFTVASQLRSVFTRHRGMGSREARSASKAMLESVGFAQPDHIMRSYPHQLSGGMRQRIMIAMAMACRPRVLIADEPTTALDVTTQAQVLGQLTRLGQQFGTSILLITHDLGVVAQYCDRAAVMHNGKIVEQAKVGELFSSPQHDYTRSLLQTAIQGIVA